jgi:uncharacterized membrane protein
MEIPAEKPEKLKIIIVGVSLAQIIFLRRTYAEKDFEKILMRVFFRKQVYSRNYWTNGTGGAE